MTEIKATENFYDYGMCKLQWEIGDFFLRAEPQGKGKVVTIIIIFG